MRVRSIVFCVLICLNITELASNELDVNNLKANWTITKEMCKNPRTLNNYKFSSKSCLLLGLYQLDTDVRDVDDNRNKINLYFKFIYPDIRKIKFKDSAEFYTELANLTLGLINTGLSDYESSIEICKDTAMLYLNIFNYNKRNNHMFDKTIFYNLEENLEAACKMQPAKAIPNEYLK